MSFMRTRFAPSPTGALHLGGARTALFNFLLARKAGGEFLLRIEDTDLVRSKEEYVDSILGSLTWLGLSWDGEPVRQSARRGAHVEAAKTLLEKGFAYRCYCTPEEVEAMREQARQEGLPPRYSGKCRDLPASVHQAKEGEAYVIRLKMPLQGETHLPDRVQGDVRVENSQLDDFILMRTDGTPTYMLGVVVDDHDMGITHIVRGVDHLTNAVRQQHLIRAFGWEAPVYAHVPLIHGTDGGKLSKRHGGLDIREYRAAGFLPEAMCNYLARLGWAHGDEEIFSMAQAQDWFSLEGIGKSPARFDAAKLQHLNAHYLRQSEDSALARQIAPLLAKNLETDGLTPLVAARLGAAVAVLKPRATNLVEMAEQALFLGETRPPLDEQSRKIARPEMAEALAGALTNTSWEKEALEEALRGFAEASGEKFRVVAQAARAALTGRAASPGIFDVLLLLGKEESLARLLTKP